MILKNKEITIDLLEDLTKLDIKDIEFEDLKNMENSSGYDFPAIKLKAIIASETFESCKSFNKNREKKLVKEQEIACRKKETELYIKMIRKDKIKESIFCYWNLLYDEKFKDYEESEFTTVINKVKITETESEEHKHSVLLEIKDNNWGVLECGSTIHLVKFGDYLNDKSIKKSGLISEWKKYLEKDNQDVLFIGVVN